jgi:hypothetical protein
MLSKSVGERQIPTVIAFIAILVITPVTATALEVLSFQSGMSPLTIMLIANVVTGAAFALVYLLHRRQDIQKRQAVNENLRIICDMNHEVRTVLGIVAFYGKEANNGYVLKVFENGFKRMESIMREVLNRGTSIDPKPSVPQSPEQSGLHLWGELRHRRKSNPLVC